MQARFEENIREQIRAALSRERQLWPGRFAVSVLEGHPGEKIIGFARAARCDLMVTGVRPRTILGRLLTGSTTETLIRQVSCHPAGFRISRDEAQPVCIRATFQILQYWLIVSKYD